MEKLPYIDPYRQRFNEIENQLSNPEIFRDPNKASSLNREHTRLKNIIELHEATVNTLSEINSTMELIDDIELGKTADEELSILKKKFKNLKEQLLVEMLPEDKESGKNTIIEIRAGAGGDEASLFAADLFECIQNLAKIKVGVSTA